ncbi:MAG: hypothetical protein ACYDBV_14905 [Nitrospiria bacterium]
MNYYGVDLNPLDLPVCPFCDNGMVSTDDVRIIESMNGGALALAHLECLTDHNIRHHLSNDDDKDGGSSQFGIGA